jgi:hypothetical protein
MIESTPVKQPLKFHLLPKIVSELFVKRGWDAGMQFIHGEKVSENSCEQAQKASAFLKVK